MSRTYVSLHVHVNSVILKKFITLFFLILKTTSEKRTKETCNITNNTSKCQSSKSFALLAISNKLEIVITILRLFFFLSWFN